jgi:hypothetical protein
MHACIHVCIYRLHQRCRPLIQSAGFVGGVDRLLLRPS